MLDNKSVLISTISANAVLEPYVTIKHAHEVLKRYMKLDIENDIIRSTN